MEGLILCPFILNWFEIFLAARWNASCKMIFLKEARESFFDFVIVGYHIYDFWLYTFVIVYYTPLWWLIYLPL